MQAVQLGVLGPLEVRRDGAALTVPRGRQRAVLAALAQHVGRPVSPGALLEAAWGPHLPDDPVAALQTVLSRLRSHLGGDAITTTTAGYLLDLPPEAVDAHRFEDLVRQARSVPAAESAPLLDQALGLWRGPAYQELTDTGFAAAEVARLEGLRLDASEERAAVRLELGRPEPVVADLEVLCAQHPYRERARTLLMTALYRAGRATEALDRYREYRDRLDRELGLRPSPALRRLEARIIGHDLEPPAAGGSAAPAPAWLDLSTGFFGREHEAAGLLEALETNRLVTVTGPGGVGKTRLAAEVLPGWHGRTRRPVVVVELAPTRPGGAVAAIAGAHGLQLPASGGVDELVEFCSTRSELLVLDNCEHVVDEVADLLRVLLRRCPTVTVLATSRRRLGLDPELVVPLEPLRSTDAVALFTDRVRRLRPDFDPGTSGARSAEEIARGVDRLPLALELAAASAATLGLSTVRARVVETGTLPDLPGGVAAPERLRSVVEWSYQLLEDDQRALLQLLSVAPVDLDGRSIEELVAADHGWLAGPVPQAVSGLVEASLLRVRDVGAVASYGMLAIVRAFAADALRRSGREERARLAHALWVRSVVEQARDTSTGPEGETAYLRLDALRPAIRTAVQWALTAGELDLAGDITGALELCPHWIPGGDLAELIVDVAEQELTRPSPRSLPVGAGAVVLADSGDVARSRELARHADGLARTPLEESLVHLAGALADLYAGDLDGCDRHARQITGLTVPLAIRADAEISLALTACYRGDPGARRQAELALAAAAASGAPAVEAFAEYAAGEVAGRDDPDRARDHFRGAAARADAVGVPHVSMVARIGLLGVQVRSGATDLPDVGRLLEDEQRAGAWPQTWTTVRIFAELVRARGHPHDACFLLAAADAADSAPPLTAEDVPRYASLLAGIRADLGHDVVSRIGELARTSPRTQVLDRAKALASELVQSTVPEEYPPAYRPSRGGYP